MSGSNVVDYDELRILAAADPRRTRTVLVALFDEGGPRLESLLKRAAHPGEGRVRQLIANAVRSHSRREDVVPHIKVWLAVETDEFARRAETAAIEEVASSESAGRAVAVDPKVVVAYRYVSDRLKHQLRNMLLDPVTQVLRLRECVARIDDQALRISLEAQISSIEDSLERFGHAIEFNPNDDQFAVRLVDLEEWLRAFNDDYARSFRQVRLTVTPIGEKVIVRASNFLLRTIFWNLWINAQQAVSGDCSIAIELYRTGAVVKITVIDNGSGFAPDSIDIVLDGKPRSRVHRGRGLLEVQDAIERLHGTLLLVNVRESFRIQLSLPLELR